MSLLRRDISHGIHGRESWSTYIRISPSVYGRSTVDNGSFSCTLSSRCGRVVCTNRIVDWKLQNQTSSTLIEWLSSILEEKYILILLNRNPSIVTCFHKAITCRGVTCCIVNDVCFYRKNRDLPFVHMKIINRSLCLPYLVLKYLPIGMLARYYPSVIIEREIQEMKNFYDIDIIS